MTPEDVVVRIGRRIRQVRMELGLSQDSLAELAEINRVNLSLIERGRAEAGVRVLVRIARALDMTLSELVEGVD